jgi:hypothetical protein
MDLQQFAGRAEQEAMTQRRYTLLTVGALLLQAVLYGVLVTSASKRRQTVIAPLVYKGSLAGKLRRWLGL